MVDFTEKDLPQVAVKSKLELDVIRILAGNTTCEITTNKIEVDANGDTVSSKTGPNFIYRDYPARNGEPESTSYTDFMTKLGLTKAKVRTAVKEMESE